MKRSSGTAPLEQANIPVITVPEIMMKLPTMTRFTGNAVDWPTLVTNPMPEKVATLSLKIPCHLYAMAYTGGLTKVTELLRNFLRRRNSVSIWAFSRLTGLGGGKEVCPFLPRVWRLLVMIMSPWAIFTAIRKTVNRTLMVYPGAVEGKPSPIGNRFLPWSSWGTASQWSTGSAAVRAHRQVKIDVSGMETEADLGKELEKVADPGLWCKPPGWRLFLPPNLAKLTAGMREGFIIWRFVMIRNISTWRR